jgi:hypothetical protein
MSLIEDTLKNTNMAHRNRIRARNMRHQKKEEGRVPSTESLCNATGSSSGDSGGVEYIELDIITDALVGIVLAGGE